MLNTDTIHCNVRDNIQVSTCMKLFEEFENVVKSKMIYVEQPSTIHIKIKDNACYSKGVYIDSNTIDMYIKKMLLDCNGNIEADEEFVKFNNIDVVMLSWNLGFDCKKILQNQDETVLILINTVNAVWKKSTSTFYFTKFTYDVQANSMSVSD